MNYLAFTFLASCALLVHAEHSILDIINTQYVEKLLAERRLNETKAVGFQQESLKGLTRSESNIDDLNEDELSDMNGNSVVPPSRLPKSQLPDIASVLSEMGKSDKFLRADPTSILVTRKENLRKDWCRTEPILQKIREDGCIPKNVVNRFCYGQCNSFYIPKNLSPRRGKHKRKWDKNEESPSFRSCGVCKPKKMMWVQVTLQCPGLNPPLRRRKVQKVKQCLCLAEQLKN